MLPNSSFWIWTLLGAVVSIGAAILVILPETSGIKFLVTILLSAIMALSVLYNWAFKQFLEVVDENPHPLCKIFIELIELDTVIQRSIAHGTALTWIAIATFFIPQLHFVWIFMSGMMSTYLMLQLHAFNGYRDLLKEIIDALDLGKNNEDDD